MPGAEIDSFPCGHTAETHPASDVPACVEYGLSGLSLGPRVIEHYVDCSTGNAVDRDYEGDLSLLLPDPAIAEREARRDAALTRLKNLALSDRAIADLLIVMEVEE